MDIAYAFAVRVVTPLTAVARVARSGSGSQGGVMIEAKITFYVFYLATAAVVGMLAFKMVEFFMT